MTEEEQTDDTITQEQIDKCKRHPETLENSSHFEEMQ
jgi:hypothetical protein